MKKQNRREFLKTTAIGTSVLLTMGCLEGQNKRSIKRPNIIFIITDQQSAGMMSCAGNKWLKTPAMDYIARNGIRFTRAYTTNPVCTPARVSLMTGRFPGSFNDKNGKPARENSGARNLEPLCEEVKNTTLGAFMQRSGYKLVFGGKRHLPAELNPQVQGFDYFCKDERGLLAEEAAKYIKSEHDKPYFMVVSLINPHDICYMALRDYATQQGTSSMSSQSDEIKALDKAMQMPKGVSEDKFYEQYCPPVPDNYEPQKDEPKAIASLLDRRKFRRFARTFYTDKQWRMHRWAYSRLTERVDSEIQFILDAIKQSGNEENTLVIFSSDHGDMDSAHRMEHKTAFYEEAANIPFVAMWKGYIKPNQVDQTHLISNGLDLLPTVCDYAGVKAKSDPRGKSLRPLFEGKKVKWRKTLGVESEVGRMVVGEDKLKYIKYDAEGIEEVLHDLNADPYEKMHFSTDPKYASRLAELRKEYQTQWFPGT